MASSSSPCGINTADIEGLDIKTYPAYMGGLRFPVGNFPTLEISPDGKSVAFDYNWETNRCDICVMSLETGETRNLTRNLKDDCYCPTWSPDSTKIAFTMETGEKLNANSMKIEKETAIYTMDADGSNPTLLIENGAYPAWQR
jgi:Tol biopolymer transport system component